MGDIEFNDYESYIASDTWRERARRIRERDDHRCQICGASDVPLEVHHLSYDRLYHERDDDLMTVCHECHERITESWHSIRDGIKARRKIKWLLRRYSNEQGLADHLNALMPFDVSFGGRYVLTGHQNIRAACNAAGIEYKFAARINDIFKKVHVLDVVTKMASGVPKWKLVNDGYPKSLLSNIGKRRREAFASIRDVDDATVCYLHEGKGKWTVSMSEDGLDSTFRVRFMPYMRYENRWWDDE